MSTFARATLGAALGIAIMAAATAPAVAAINETNDKKASEAKVAEQLAAVKSACGNASLTATVDWSPLDSYDYDTAKLEKEQLIYTMGAVMKDHAKHLQELCEKDPAYKAAISRLGTIAFQPTKELQPTNWTTKVSAKVSGNRLTIVFRPHDSPAGTDNELVENAL